MCVGKEEEKLQVATSTSLLMLCEVDCLLLDCHCIIDFLGTLRLDLVDSLPKAGPRTSIATSARTSAAV